MFVNTYVYICTYIFTHLCVLIHKCLILIYFYFLAIQQIKIIFMCGYIHMYLYAYIHTYVLKIYISTLCTRCTFLYVHTFAVVRLVFTKLTTHTHTYIIYLFFITSIGKANNQQFCLYRYNLCMQAHIYFVYTYINADVCTYAPT